jgi:hypothetical protein
MLSLCAFNHQDSIGRSVMYYKEIQKNTWKAFELPDRGRYCFAWDSRWSDCTHSAKDDGQQQVRLRLKHPVKHDVLILYCAVTIVARATCNQDSPAFS